MIDFEALKAPFPVEKISWRVGATTKTKDKAIGLAYIDARDLYERLDDVCGPANWQIRYPHANGKTCAEIGIKIDNEWVWKANGAGDSDVEAEKGAFSDAAKRAGVLWGIGRYLYDMPNIWVPIDQYKKFTPEALKTLQAGLKKLSVEPKEKPDYVKKAEKIRSELESCTAFEVLQRTWENATDDLNEIERKNPKTFKFIEEKVYHKKLNELAESPLPEVAE